MDELELELYVRQVAQDVANSYFELYLEQLRRKDTPIREFIWNERDSLNASFGEAYMEKRYNIGMGLNAFVKECKFCMGLVFTEMLQERIDEMEDDLKHLREQLKHYEEKDEEFEREAMQEIQGIEKTITEYKKRMVEYRDLYNKK